MSPSPAQLAAMARSDPQSLAQVANFTIGRQRMGKIRWIEPVDVRRLDIDSTVRFSKDTCEVRSCTTCGPRRRLMQQSSFLIGCLLLISI